MRRLLLVIPLFLLLSFSSYHYWDEYFYLFSVHYHTPGELLKLEPGLSLSVFPNGFFSGKLGFILILRMIVQIFGSGYWSLIIIQFIFAIIMIGFILASYGILREICEEKEALYSTIVLTFLPLSIYLGYKTLSEVPSLLFITLGSLGFLRSFQVKNRRQLWGYLLLAIGGLFIGIVCRFVSILFFAGLILALLVLQHQHYYWKAVLIRASFVSIITLLILMGVWISIIGLPISQFSELIISVTGRSPGVAVKIYALAMSVQLFLPALLLSVKPPYDRITLSALAWASVCMLPFIIFSTVQDKKSE